MLTIQVVFLNGRLVGRRFSDRWGLDWMTREFCGVVLCNTRDITTRTDVDRLRRCLAEHGFALRLHADSTLVGITHRERLALRPATPGPARSRSRRMA